MDPNETYRLLREHLAYLSSHQPDSISDGDTWADHARAVVKLFGDLDRWLSYGGFRPTAWNPTAHVPELDGQMGFVRGDDVRAGDVLLFPAREVSAVDASGLTPGLPPAAAPRTLTHPSWSWYFAPAIPRDNTQRPKSVHSAVPNPAMPANPAAWPSSRPTT